MRIYDTNSIEIDWNFCQAFLARQMILPIKKI